MDLLDALTLTDLEFRGRLTAVSAEMWTASTPCPDWDVHYLVAHVVGGNRFAALILGGLTTDEAMLSVMSSPQLGADPVDAWVETAAAQRDAFADNRDGSTLVDHPLGRITVDQFLGFRVFDIAVHAWDLARAIGAEEDLRPDLVDRVLTIVADGPPGMGFGIEPLGKATSSSTAQERLLDSAGRA